MSERERVLLSLKNLAVAQELEALRETNPDMRRGMIAVIGMIWALIEVEEARPADEVLRWALTTSALGVPHLFRNNPQDSSFVRGHRLACAQILDVIENGWVNRRDPLDIYRDLGLT